MHYLNIHVVISERVLVMFTDVQRQAAANCKLSRQKNLRTIVMSRPERSFVFLYGVSSKKKSVVIFNFDQVHGFVLKFKIFSVVLTTVIFIGVETESLSKE